ncbi:unnamed protein product, partial [marine sediment metagenome]
MGIKRFKWILGLPHYKAVLLDARLEIPVDPDVVEKV